MEDDRTAHLFPSEIIDSMRPFLKGDENYYQVRTDILDINEAVAWLNNFSKKKKWSNLDELETAMIEMDVSFISHIEYHIKSLKRNMKYALEKVAELQTDSLKSE
jgi:hypothetical protein